jgi:hypothetical protein
LCSIALDKALRSYTMRYLRSLVCVLGDLLSSHVICSCTIFGNELTVNTDAGDSHVTRVLGLFVYTSNSGKHFMSKSLSQVFCCTVNSLPKIVQEHIT